MILATTYRLFTNYNKYRRVCNLICKWKQAEAIAILKKNPRLALKKDIDGWNLYDLAVACKCGFVASYIKEAIEIEHTKEYLKYKK